MSKTGRRVSPRLAKISVSERRCYVALPTLQAFGQVFEPFQFDDLTVIPWLPRALLKSDAFRWVRHTLRLRRLVIASPSDPL